MRQLVIYKPISTRELKQYLVAARLEFRLDHQFRQRANQISVLPKLLPGENSEGKRFYRQDGLIDNFVEVASIISNHYSLEQGILTIQTELGLFFKNAIMQISGREREELIDLCLYALIHPHEFKTEKLLDRHKNEVFLKLKSEHFATFYAKKPPLYDLYALNPEQIQAHQRVTDFFAKPEDVPFLMDQFFRNTPRLAAQRRWSPRQLAAYVHNEIIRIHPFCDGNGRTARYMVGQIFKKYNLPPMIDVKKDRKTELTYDRLVASNDDQALASWFLQEENPQQSNESSIPTVEFYPASLFSVHQRELPDARVSLTVRENQFEGSELSLLDIRKTKRSLFFQPQPVRFDAIADYLIDEESFFTPRSLV